MLQSAMCVSRLVLWKRNKFIQTFEETWKRVASHKFYKLKVSIGDTGPIPKFAVLHTTDIVC